MSKPLRLTVVSTHPVQYQAPWYRHLTAHHPELDLVVLYATVPTAEQQGVGFQAAFTWDSGVLEGYHSHVVRPPSPHHRFDRFRGVDVPEITEAIAQTRPDVVLVPGWNSITLVRALRFCRHHRIPLLYRGDTHLGNRPSGWKKDLWTSRNRWRLRHFDAWLSVGERAHRFFRYLDLPEERIIFAPHCVDNDAFAAAAAPWQDPGPRRRLRQELGLPENGFVVLFAGKLQARKRPADLIDALARLGSSATLLVAGSGELEASLRARAREHGVPAVWMGFVNQSGMPRLYAAADCLALPSDWSETWGLVVNEALACGRPCVVSDRVGCAPDLVTSGETGEVFHFGDIEDFARALGRLRVHPPEALAATCRQRARRYSFSAASAGLVQACRALCPPPAASAAQAPPLAATRVLGCCGGMVVIFGLERSIFDILQVAREGGAAVHCILNDWENFRAAAWAEKIGATWSEGGYHDRLTRRLSDPKGIFLGLRDVVRTSFALLQECRRFHPTHILIPEVPAALRNAPALLWCRARGVKVVFPVENTPPPARFYRNLWRRGLNPLVDRFACISHFVERAVLDQGIPPGKVTQAYLTAPFRPASAPPAAPRDSNRIAYVGQIIPSKGVHLLLDAVGHLRARGVDACLDVIGPIEGWVSPAFAGYRESLRVRAGAADLRGHVDFLGQREDVPALLARAAVHCCPSLPEQREALGLVNLEAKQAGTPSVVFPTGALPELIDHLHDGWVCRDCSAESLAEGLEYFLSDPERARRAGEQALRSAAAFNRAAFARNWSALFG